MYAILYDISTFISIFCADGGKVQPRRVLLAGEKPYLIVIQQRTLNFWLGGIRHGEMSIIGGGSVSWNNT